MKIRCGLAIGICLFLALFSGCVSFPVSKVGKSYDTKKLSSLKLKESTKKEALGLFGTPFKKDTRIKGDERIDLLYYSYAIGTFTRVYSRELTLEFRNDVFNGYVYQSNFAEDNTNFDDKLFDKLRKGISTKRDVERILGQPKGIIYEPTDLIITLAIDNKPKDDEGVVEVWRYWYFLTDSLQIVKRKNKILILGFDKDGVLKRIEFASTFQ